MFVFFVGTAKARDESFVIQPKQEAVEYVNLAGSGNASGNLSASQGQIDFFIRDPNGIIIQEFLNVSTTPFSFVADKKGNYSMCMDSNYEAFNVTVILDYTVELRADPSASIGVSSSGTAHVYSVMRPPFLNLQDDEGSDYVIGPYRAFQDATQMLRVIDSGSAFLPFRGVNLTGCIVASVMALVWVAGIELCTNKHRLSLRQIRYLNAH
jgi:hypothetical protein